MTNQTLRERIEEILSIDDAIWNKFRASKADAILDLIGEEIEGMPFLNYGGERVIRIDDLKERLK